MAKQGFRSWGPVIVSLLIAGIIGFSGVDDSTRGQTPLDNDLQVLKNAGIASDNSSLQDFFRHRTLQENDQKDLESLIKKLASEVFSEREKATIHLQIRGTVALPFLKAALKDSPLEVVRRIELILKKIEGTGPDIPVAAARVLAKQDPKALPILLQYLQSAGDEWIEEEISKIIGENGFKLGKMDPALFKALDDSNPARRAAALYIVGRWGDLDHRQMVRSHLEDADPAVQRKAFLGLTGKRIDQTFLLSREGDEQLVTNQGIGKEDHALAEFIRKRTLTEKDQERLKSWIQDLGDSNFKTRNTASKLLTKEGTPALAFLMPALNHPSAEIARRAELCIEEIRRGPGPALPTAVVRLLSQASKGKTIPPSTAIRLLLDYIPFADDEMVEEEVQSALTLLSCREVKVDPTFIANLGDPLPSRRAAAALILGRVGTKDQIPLMTKLLGDPTPSVRYRTAQGLLAARDKTAVAHLIPLLAQVPQNQQWGIEDILNRLSSDKIPADAVEAGENRAKLVKAWEKWWQNNQSQVELTRLNNHDLFMGLFTVSEYDSPNGQPTGQVWEAGRDGKPRWNIKENVMGAMDSQLLPNGRVLIAENSGNRISERDMNGKIVWEYRPPGNPIACQRLPNGNTFIATYNQVLEITPANKVLYTHNKGPAFYIFSAQKTKSGNVVCMTAQGVIHEFEAVSGKDIRTINLGANGGWCSVESLANGRYLVATMGTGTVREIDAQGKSHWQLSYPGVFRATRLPNGNTLVASMNTKKIAEYDRDGKQRWEKTCEGRPWSLHYR